MAYEALAAVYDGLMAPADYEKRAAYLDRKLRRREAKTVLDLGCGTGTIACLLAERGYQVVGVDSSPDMLAQAAAKAQDLPAPPFFVHQSMPRLRLTRPVDAAVSTIDALNYLTSVRDLKAAFRRVRRWLRPGGVFLFDVNTPYKFRQMDGQVYLDEREGLLCVWRTFFSERTALCTYQVDLFRQGPDGRWARQMEEHRERAWSREDLTACLLEAGFSKVRVTGDLTARPPGETETRWQFLAQ